MSENKRWISNDTLSYTMHQACMVKSIKVKRLKFDMLATRDFHKWKNDNDFYCIPFYIKHHNLTIIHKRKKKEENHTA